MPQWLVAAAGLGAAAGAIGLTSATLFGSTILGGAALYGGLALASYLLRPKTPSFGTADRTITTTIRTGLAPARWIVGRARTGGVLAYLMEPTNQDHDIHLVLILAQGEIEGIERVWLDGEEVEWETEAGKASAKNDTAPNAVNFYPVEGNKYRGHLSMYAYYNGMPDGNPLTLVEGQPAESQWTDSHGLNGLACVYIKLNQPTYNDAAGRLYKGVPNFEFLVKGQKITYPGQESPVWTDNAAAIRYWWLTERREVPADTIDTDNFKKAFDYCGVQVNNELTAAYDDLNGYTKTSPRYSLNGVIQSGDDHDRTEAEMDFAWAGNVVEVGGVHYFRPGRDDNIGRTIRRIEPSDIISRQSIQPAPALADRLNAASMRLSQSSALDWQPASVDELEDSEGITRDGQRLPRDLGQRTLVCCPSTAGRLLAVMIRRARAQKRYNITITPGDTLDWFKTIPTDLVIYNDPELGVNNVRCVVMATTLNEDFSVSLSLEQQLVGTHADDAILPPLYQNRRTASRRKPLPPTGITITPSARATDDGTAHSIITISWDDTAHATVINVKGTEALGDIYSHQYTEYGNEISIEVPLGAGVYTVELQHRDRLGLLSDTITRKVTVDWSDLPDAVYIQSIVKNPETGVITITYNTGNTITFGGGKGIQSITRNETTGIVTITYSDGTSEAIDIQDGAAGGKSEWIYRATISASRPTTPTTTEAQDSILDFVPSGWNDAPPDGTYVWVSTRTRALVTDAYSKFSQPIQFRGPPGERGARGATGPRGLPGTPAPRVWSLIFKADVDDLPGTSFQVQDQNPFPGLHPGGFWITNQGWTFTMRANITNYDWICLIGRGKVMDRSGAGLAFNGMISTSLLKSTRRAHQLPTLSGWTPTITYVSDNQINIYGSTNSLASQFFGILDEVWGVES